MWKLILNLTVFGNQTFIQLFQFHIIFNTELLDKAVTSVNNSSKEISPDVTFN